MYYMPIKIQRAVKCIILVAYMFFSMFISTLLAAWILNKMDPEFSKSIVDIMLGTTSSGEVATKYLEIPSIYIFNLLLFIPLSIHALRHKDIPLKKISFKTGFKIASVGISLNAVLSFFALITVLISGVTVPTTEIPSGANGFAFILSVCLITPLIEELYFRYGMIGLFGENKYYGIVMSSLLFSLVHGNIPQMAASLISGILFGFIYVKSENFAITLIMHIAFNTIATIFSFNSIAGTIISAIFVIVVLIQLINKEKRTELINVFGLN